jgi:hypothetical protein
VGRDVGGPFERQRVCVADLEQLGRERRIGRARREQAAADGQRRHHVLARTDASNGGAGPEVEPDDARALTHEQAVPGQGDGVVLIGEAERRREAVVPQRRPGGGIERNDTAAAGTER